MEDFDFIAQWVATPPWTEVRGEYVIVREPYWFPEYGCQTWYWHYHAGSADAAGQLAAQWHALFCEQGRIPEEIRALLKPGGAPDPGLEARMRRARFGPSVEAIHSPQPSVTVEARSVVVGHPAIDPNRIAPVLLGPGMQSLLPNLRVEWGDAEVTVTAGTFRAIVPLTDDWWADALAVAHATISALDANGCV